MLLCSVSVPGPGPGPATACGPCCPVRRPLLMVMTAWNSKRHHFWPYLKYFTYVPTVRLSVTLLLPPFSLSVALALSASGDFAHFQCLHLHIFHFLYHLQVVLTRSESEFSISDTCRISPMILIRFRCDSLCLPDKVLCTSHETVIRDYAGSVIVIT